MKIGRGVEGNAPYNGGKYEGTDETKRAGKPCPYEYRRKPVRKYSCPAAPDEKR